MDFERDIRPISDFKRRVAEQSRKSSALMMSASIAWIVFATALSGCSGITNYNEDVSYYKNGSSAEDLEIAKAKCRMGLQTLTPIESTQKNIPDNPTNFYHPFSLGGQQMMQTGQSAQYAAASAAGIMASQLRDKRYFENCMLVQGYRKGFANSPVSGQEYQKQLKRAQKQCKQEFPQKKLGDSEFNQCVAAKLK